MQAVPVLRVSLSQPQSGQSEQLAAVEEAVSPQLHVCMFDTYMYVIPLTRELNYKNP